MLNCNKSGKLVLINPASTQDFSYNLFQNTWILIRCRRQHSRKQAHQISLTLPPLMGERTVLCLWGMRVSKLHDASAALDSSLRPAVWQEPGLGRQHQLQAGNWILRGVRVFTQKSPFLLALKLDLSCAANPPPPPPGECTKKKRELQNKAKSKLHQGESESLDRVLPFLSP